MNLASIGYWKTTGKLSFVCVDDKPKWVTTWMICWMKLNPKWLKKLKTKLLLITAMNQKQTRSLQNRWLAGARAKTSVKIWPTLLTTFSMTALNWISITSPAQLSELRGTATCLQRASVFHSWSVEVLILKACPPLSPSNAAAISDVTTAISV